MKFFKRLGRIAQGIGRGVGNVSDVVNKVLPIVAPFLAASGPKGQALLKGAQTGAGVGSAVGNLARM